MIEPIECQDFAGADLAFQLGLGGAEEAFDQSAGRRIAYAAVEQADVQGKAGRLQGMSVVNLGIVQVQLTAGPMNRPSPQQGVDEDVQVFAEVVAGLDHVAAVAVDEGRQMRGHRPIAAQHIGPVLEIAQPQGVGMVPRPTATDLPLTDAQLQPRGPGPLQVAIEGRFGDRSALNSDSRNWLMGTWDRRGCSFFSSIALAIIACGTLRDCPRSLRRLRNRASKPPSRYFSTSATRWPATADDAARPGRRARRRPVG